MSDRHMEKAREISEAIATALAEAEREGMRRAAEWQDIDTAPADGSAFLAWDGFHVFICFRNGGIWQDQPTCSPRPWTTHWMPLPEPPAILSEAGIAVTD